MNTTLAPKPAVPSRRAQPVRWPRPTLTLRPPPLSTPALAGHSPVQTPVNPSKVPRPSSAPPSLSSLPLSARDTLPEIPDFDVVDETTLELEALGGQIDDDDDDDRPTLECFPKIGFATTWEVPVSRSVDTLPPTGLAPCPGCGHRNGRHCDRCSVCGHRLACHERHPPKFARLPAPALWAPVLMVMIASACLLAVVATGGTPEKPTARQPLWSEARGTPVTITPSALLRISTVSTAASGMPSTSATKSRVAHVKTSRTHKLASSPYRKNAPATRPPSHKPRSPHKNAGVPRR